MEINEKIAKGIVIKNDENEIAYAERKDDSTPIIREIWVKCKARDLSLVENLKSKSLNS